MLFGIVSVYRVTKIRLEREVTSKSSSCVFMFSELRGDEISARDVMD
jgi:hypothetical protein